MLTLATLEDFKVAKQIRNIKPGSSGISQERLDEAEDKIQDYLIRATRYIQRFTRREFFPWRETRKFAVPHQFLDLSMRRFTAADLYLDNDLLRVYELLNANGAELVQNTDYFLIDSNTTPHYAVQLKFPNFWGGLTGGAVMSYSFDEPIIEIDAEWGFHDLYRRPNEAWVDTLSVVPAGGMTDTQNELTISSLTQRDALYLPAWTIGRMLKVGEEYMEVVEVHEGTTPDFIHQLQVLRGIRGSTAVAHDEDEKIYRWHVVDDVTEACLQIAKVWREADTSAGGRLGVSDMSAGVEIGIPADPLNTIKMYQRSIVGFNV